MPPRKKTRGNVLTTTSTHARPTEDGDAAVDRPAPQRPSSSVVDSLWSDDQIVSLFKGVIKWKPAGMHKHFRIIAISEHLRAHGIDPDRLPHTRIPAIWEKLRDCYNLDVIDEREQNFDGDDDLTERFHDFSLPPADFGAIMLQRALADPSEAPTSPRELDLSPPLASSPPSMAVTSLQGSKRSYTEDSTIDATEETLSDRSPLPTALLKSARGRRGAGRRLNSSTSSRSTAAKSKAQQVEEDKQDEGNTDSEGDGSDPSEHAEGSSSNRTLTQRSTRGYRARGTRGRRGRRRGR